MGHFCQLSKCINMFIRNNLCPYKAVGLKYSPSEQCIMRLYSYSLLPGEILLIISYWRHTVTQSSSWWKYSVVLSMASGKHYNPTITTLHAKVQIILFLYLINVYRKIEL